jgi:hypothetical protein
MKRIELPHKVCGMTCMVNGLEDMYEWKTGQRLPDWLLFYVSGLGAGFTYVKNKRALSPCMVFWGVTIRQQYAALAEEVGFTWKIHEGRSFAYALEQAKAHVDRDTPVILGALDMFHLPYYERFYHHFHVPIHYVLLVGYDDKRAMALVYDCDRPDAQGIPYTDLQAAWNVNVPGLSKKNTFFVFEFNSHLADIATIARDGLRRRAEAMLKPPVGILGLKGMRKLARELSRWPVELSPAQLDAALHHLAEYTGFPPALPSRLMGYTDAPDNHAAGRDGLANLLNQLVADYNRPAWTEAAVLFKQSGQTLEKMTDAIVDFVLGEGDTLEPASKLVGQVADLEEQAYTIIATSEREA